MKIGFSQPDFFDEVVRKIIPKYEENTISKVDQFEHRRDVNKILQALKQVFSLATNKNKKNRCYKQKRTVD